MTSPYLTKPVRPQHVVMEELLANMRETHLIVFLYGGEPYIEETELGQSFNAVVTGIIEGQHDINVRGHLVGPVAVLRMSRDEPTENVSEKVADEIVKRLSADRFLTYDDEGYLFRRPFLDNVRPDWEHALPYGPGKRDRNYEPDEAA